MSYLRWSVLLFALATALVLFTFGDYGVTWDESFHVRYGDGVLEYITSGLPIARRTAISTSSTTAQRSI